MSMEARNRALQEWFTRIRTRQLVLPRFQRFEAWPHPKVAQLFNTILQTLPVGALLVLEIGQEEPFVSRTLKGAPESGERVAEHLLDGQQRLTALWRGFHNNYDDRTYFIYLMPDEESGLPYYVGSISRYTKAHDQQRRPLWANDPVEQWRKRMIPLDLFRPDSDAQQQYRAWAKIAIPKADEREGVSDTVSDIRQKFAAFNLPFMSLPATTKKETALDVFITLNTSAEPLTIYDIVVAQVEATMGKSLHDLVSDIRRVCPTISAYYSPEELLLNANALLQGRVPANGTYVSKDFGSQLLTNWDAFVRGIKQTLTLLEEERIFDAARLPTDVVIPVLVALWAVAPQGLDAEGRTRMILRQYLWRAFFTNRYESSTNSKSLVDVQQLRATILDTSAPTPAIFDNAQYSLPQPEELMAADWPKRRDRLPRAILALALRQGGCDLADGAPVTRENLAQREYHHLFPNGYLSKSGNVENADRALNCALITWQTNRNISDKNPKRYLAERFKDTGVPRTRLTEYLASHLIPYEEMEKEDYSAFLNARAVLIHDAMTKRCGRGTV